jgi:hypothetical protein
VAGAVGERLLDDPVRGEIDAGRQRLLLAGSLDADAEPGGSRVLEQLTEAAEARARRPCGVLVDIAQYPEDGADLDQRLLTYLADGLQRQARALRLPVH